MKSNCYAKALYGYKETHEGAQSSPTTPLQRLKRLTMACMLWEDTFYVDGISATEQIVEVCKQVPKEKIVEVALDCHQKGLLRHIPLFLIVQALKKHAICSDAIATICSRPDQMTELLTLYWKEGKKPLASQLKKGLAKAFQRFDRYQLGKYNRDAPIKLRDVLFLCHAKPKDADQAQDWKDLVNKKLESPETWEVKLSAGEKKEKAFHELLAKGKMGKLAILRNLRNMHEAGIDKDLVQRQLIKSDRPMLPFQFLAAARACPQWESMIDSAMIASIQGKERLSGRNVILVDVSRSMDQAISGKSEMTRMEAACALAILLREITENTDVFSFSNQLAYVPLRQGMALRDAIMNSQPNTGTDLGGALNAINASVKPGIELDRIIVITDEQTCSNPPYIKAKRGYIINVGSYANGILNNGQWLTVSGFSEHVIDYIIECEKQGD